MAVGNMDTRGNRGNSKFGQIPVKEGEIYDVEIEGIGEKGITEIRKVLNSFGLSLKE